jgi:hypothetical protein
MRDAYPERELELYTQCPARYRYEVIEGLWGGRDESAYVRFIAAFTQRSDGSNPSARWAARSMQ